MEPAVRDDSDEVVGRKRVEHRDCEAHVRVLRDPVLWLRVPLSQEELVVAVVTEGQLPILRRREGEASAQENNLAVDVLDEDPERLDLAVYLLVPREIGRDRELNLEH